MLLSTLQPLRHAHPHFLSIAVVESALREALGGPCLNHPSLRFAVGRQLDSRMAVFVLDGMTEPVVGNLLFPHGQFGSGRAVFGRTQPVLVTTKC